MKQILLILAFGLLPMMVPGQTLAELLSQVTTENLSLKAMDKTYLAALEKAPQVRQIPNTEFGLGVFPLPVETRLGAQAARISIAQMFPWFGTLKKKEELALTSAQALNQLTERQTLEVTFQLKQAYFQWYQLQEAQDIIQEKLGLLDALNDLALTNIESGSGSAADVLRIDLRKQSLQTQIEILVQQAKKPLASINQLLNRPIDTPLQLREKLQLTPRLYQRDSILQAIRSHHPQLQQLSLLQQVAQQKIALNKLENKPSLGMGMDYLMVNPRSDATPTNNGRDIVQIGLKARIPLYRDKYKAKAREEQFKIESLDIQKANLETQFMAKIEQAFTDQEVAQTSAELYENQKETIGSSIRILQAQYMNAGSSFDELLSLEMELIEYELKILEAIVQSHQAIAAIERYLVN